MLQRGQVVRSAAGRDAGRLMAVLAAGEEGVWIADGRERPLQRPKRKNPRHVVPEKAGLDEPSMATNRELRRALARIDRTQGGMSQEGG